MLIARACQRDEALNEARVAYFLSSLGYSIVGWEVTDAPPGNVEFEISLGHRTGFVEVKSPGWESELSPAERTAGRTKQEKHINLESRRAKPIEIIQRTVDKALPKFSGNAPSLLVISDDCFVNLGKWGCGPMKMALTESGLGYGDGLFQKPGYHVLGGVALYWIKETDPSDVHYASICLPNPNASSAALPAGLVSQLCTLPVEPIQHLIHPARWSRF